MSHIKEKVISTPRVESHSLICTVVGTRIFPVPTENFCISYPLQNWLHKAINLVCLSSRYFLICTCFSMFGLLICTVWGPASLVPGAAITMLVSCAIGKVLAMVAVCPLTTRTGCMEFWELGKEVGVNFVVNITGLWISWGAASIGGGAGAIGMLFWATGLGRTYKKVKKTERFIYEYCKRTSLCKSFNSAFIFHARLLDYLQNVIFSIAS